MNLYLSKSSMPVTYLSESNLSGSYLSAFNLSYQKFCSIMQSNLSDFNMSNQNLFGCKWKYMPGLICPA